jgi:hypothetical protein
MSGTRNTALFAAALVMTTGAVALDHANNGVPERAPVATATPAPGGTAPCAVGAAPCAVGAPAPAAPCAVGAPQALAAPPPPPRPREEERTLAPPPPPPLQRP